MNNPQRPNRFAAGLTIALVGSILIVLASLLRAVQNVQVFA